MKTNIFRVLIITVATAMILTANVFADCPDETWTFGSTITIMQPPHCGVLVTYCYRTVTGGGQIYHDLWFDEIRFIGNCDECRLQFETDPRSIYDLAFARVAALDPWNANELYPLCPDQSEPMWRFGHATCFKTTWTVNWVPDDPTGATGHYEYVKEVCPWSDENNTCWTKMTACVTLSGSEWIVHYTPVESTSGDPCPEECESMCE